MTHKRGPIVDRAAIRRMGVER